MGRMDAEADADEDEELEEVVVEEVDPVEVGRTAPEPSEMGTD